MSELPDFSQKQNLKAKVDASGQDSASSFVGQSGATSSQTPFQFVEVLAAGNHKRMIFRFLGLVLRLVSPCRSHIGPDNMADIPQCAYAKPALLELSIGQVVSLSE
jgi:hypothetical protein